MGNFFFEIVMTEASAHVGFNILRSAALAGIVMKQAHRDVLVLRNFQTLILVSFLVFFVYMLRLFPV